MAATGMAFPVSSPKDESGAASPLPAPADLLPASWRRPRWQRRERPPVVGSDGLAVYFDQMSRFETLSRQEEIDLARHIQQYSALVQRRREAETEAGAPLTRQAWAELCGLTLAQLDDLCASGIEARRRLIEANLRLVVSVARRYYRPGFAFLDLLQEGNLSLGRAADRFDPTLGWRFSTYACWWIRQGLGRALHNQASTIRVPTGTGEKLQRMRRVERQLTQQLGRRPQLEEVAAQMGMRPQTLQRMLVRIPRLLSLERRISGESDTRLGELLEADAPDPLETAHQDMLTSQVRQELATLPERERHILSLRFGFTDGISRTRTEIARQLKLSPTRILQLETRALERLRQSSLGGYHEAV